MDNDTNTTPRLSRATRKLPLRQAKIKTPARETRSTAAYFSSPGSTQDSSAETENHLPVRNLRPLRKKRKSSTPTASPTSAKSTKRQRIHSPVGQSPLHHHRRHAQSKTTPDDNIFDIKPVVCPPWHTLPYHVWLRVFDSVAAPIRDIASRIDDVAEALGTLLSGAQACKATAEPALTGLYKCPPFHRANFNKSPQVSFAQFLTTLALPPSETLVRYRPKVEILRIDVDTLLSKKVQGVQLTLKRVIKNLPRLSHLELYHPSDDPPYRDLNVHLRWRLAEGDLLEALGAVPDENPSADDQTAPTALQSWRWNSRLVPETFTLDRLSEIHKLPSFQNLRKLAYVNYQLPSLTHFSARVRDSQEAQNSDVQAIAHLAASISVLPNLEHLVIESSTLANGSLLERLPKTLTHLELVNCWEITSEDLATFLISHGNSLVHLTLKHCQSLSLGFLPVLGASCPNLAHLEVDLSYFSHHAFYADNKPEYAVLLGVDQVPTWPSSIQSIEIIHMRNWTREAAEMFFDSLMNNASRLPHLRRLEFKVILNIEWRQRQEMRQSLADQMTRIFKRKSKPPKEQKTLRQIREMKPKVLISTTTSKPTARRSIRIADQSSTPVAVDGGALSSSGRDLDKILPVSKDLESLKLVASTFDADDEDSSEDELAMSHADAYQSRHKNTTSSGVSLRNNDCFHGLCDIVDIQVDNQRPAERQYDMEDFLDSPEESDPEWNSDEDNVFN
ncbi:hypothetical protein F5Y19DRAFT_413338 [Xylariaceae sp. FL1651]|nr:hypothetical protein F5Y19DRAFT_413338 [Xylariaceae sp. FL1651]